MYHYQYEDSYEGLIELNVVTCFVFTSLLRNPAVPMMGHDQLVKDQDTSDTSWNLSTFKWFNDSVYVKKRQFSWRIIDMTKTLRHEHQKSRKPEKPDRKILWVYEFLFTSKSFVAALK